MQNDAPNEIPKMNEKNCFNFYLELLAMMIKNKKLTE